MASKILAQILIQASAVFSRAAVQAYGQALQNAKRGGGAAAKATGNAAARARLGKMQTQEALDVLNIQKADMSKDTVKEAFEKFYKLNDPAKGGSFYLQSKFYRANEALLYELDPNAKKAEEEAEDEEGETEAISGDKEKKDKEEK
jgi:mitochondrial import inner membrane translocase subunit TIM16